MSAWSLTNLNTQSPSISNLSAHVDLFLLVRIYVSSPSLPGLSSNMLQGWADLFRAVHGVHIAFILCICMQSRPAANATFRRWSSCSCVTCVIFPYQNWKVRSTSFSNSPTPSYAACVWHMRMQPHTKQQLPRHIQPFLPGAGTAWDIDALVHVLIGRWTCVTAGSLKAFHSRVSRRCGHLGPRQAGMLVAPICKRRHIRGLAAPILFESIKDYWKYDRLSIWVSSSSRCS